MVTVETRYAEGDALDFVCFETVLRHVKNINTYGCS